MHFITVTKQSYSRSLPAVSHSRFDAYPIALPHCGDITPYSEALRDYLAPLHLGVQDPQGIALAAKAVIRQAQGLAYIDSFWFATANFVLMLPLILLIHTPAKAGPAPAQVNSE
ncbi:MAG: hypothetical protein PXX77_09085 [Gallionella sp.]|nr:hypothetical protein [Gallionella sp.]